MQRKRAFVIMPFSPTSSEKNWTEVFEGLFKPAFEDCEYECVRAEPSRQAADLTGRIRRLRDSDLT